MQNRLYRHLPSWPGPVLSGTPQHGPTPRFCSWKRLCFLLNSTVTFYTCIVAYGRYGHYSCEWMLVQTAWFKGIPRLKRTPWLTCKVSQLEVENAIVRLSWLPTELTSWTLLFFDLAELTGIATKPYLIQWSDKWDIGCHLCVFSEFKF